MTSFLVHFKCVMLPLTQNMLPDTALQLLNSQENWPSPSLIANPNASTGPLLRGTGRGGTAETLLSCRLREALGRNGITERCRHS